MSIAMADQIEVQAEQGDLGDAHFSWFVNEYDKHERSKRWYIVAISLALVLLLFAFFTSNFLFAVIIIIVSLITILHDGQEPASLEVALLDEGILVGKKYYDYDEFSGFSMVYKPSQGVRRLYFEFTNPVRPRVSLSLDGLDPLPIREFLLKYLPEDLERTDEPLSEGLARILKL